ncbi:MAG: AraC family transcriptional regulator [Gammaproteobacteria bacterium]|nr:AraC family transcriptional regulator [Gammaproteobacteria bacterium]NIR83201.1 AraC family transcriptional regulator [Gammaproteobacteria bacterium]NIR91009.1 AraC family transcriptional regulator [Gammaproteobacteria bacterium]NIU04366.1 AraC family transcriptional regulator [Gammaproteobacteria bacterium]NIV52589.1 helix-turn-helix domain-containing protein [Gammaproteobacteria bacterium]
MLLDRLLDGLDVGVADFVICDIRAGASFIAPERAQSTVHYVLAGEASARTMDGRAMRLTAHTVVIVPPRACLVISCGSAGTLSLPRPECRTLTGDWKHVTVGTGAPGVMLVCGTLRARHRAGGGLFDLLSTPMVESVADEPRFREPFSRLLDELAAPQAGTRTLAALLMGECLTVLLRRYCVDGECRAPWVIGLEDRRFGAVISAVVGQPQYPFTLQGLAQMARMSRTAFAQNFKKAFRRTPMDFVREVRLRCAARLLACTSLPVKTIAWRVGFSSRSHFSRAFKAFASEDPVRYRARRAGGFLQAEGWYAGPLPHRGGPSGADSRGGRGSAMRTTIAPYPEDPRGTFGKQPENQARGDRRRQ